MAQYKGYSKDLSELDMANLKSDYEFALLHKIVDIEFVKVDGTERKMKATLDPAIIEDLIGPMDSDDGKKERKQNDSICRVFDVEVKAWRSFRWNSLIIYSDDSYGC